MKRNKSSGSISVKRRSGATVYISPDEGLRGTTRNQSVPRDTLLPWTRAPSRREARRVHERERVHITARLPARSEQSVWGMSLSAARCACWGGRECPDLYYFCPRVATRQIVRRNTRTHPATHMRPNEVAATLEYLFREGGSPPVLLACQTVQATSSTWT